MPSPSALALAAAVAWPWAVPTTALQSSTGCEAAGAGHYEEASLQELTVQDFEVVRRHYWLAPAPVLLQQPAASAQPRRPAALLLSFHGQFGSAKDYAEDHDFGRFLPTGEHLLAVYPQGMDDGHLGTGWNVGAGGDTSICQKGTASDCYSSCTKLNQCGSCNWSTCFDDRIFVKALLISLANRFCLDLDRVYLHGESNGGMFVHYLTQEFPGTFAAAVTFYGLPLVGYAAGAESEMLRQTSLLMVHGRQDTCIPPAGGVSDDGWIYEGVQKVGAVWSSLHGCSRTLAPPAAWPAQCSNGSLSCEEYAACRSGRRVVSCYYDGVHGTWPQQTSGEELTAWFVTQFSRNTAGAPDLSPSFRVRVEETHQASTTVSLGTNRGRVLHRSLDTMVRSISPR